ncbi:MAG TPA: ABC transporter ATP-binding protein [Ktedonobacteraceae bacterium]|nr:ABC transporter ATP-binding protein [Ktedonobacteraceae bacterium]
MVELFRAPELPEGEVASDFLLEIEDLAFGYSQQVLLYGVRVQVRRQEMIGLLGPNGSGKTTLLRLISGILQPSSGSIVVEGRLLTSWGRRRLAQRIAVVPQELQVPFAFTVEQMVGLGRTPFINLFGLRTRHDLQIIRDAMHQAEVDVLSERVFNELSGGERQRVMVAMALAQQPRLLLLDEPTSHLDIKYQVEMLELVKRLNRETGVTVIAAMHDLNLAARYFPRLLLFQRGVVADGGPAEVLEPQLLQRVYGITVQVGVMRGAEHLSVLPPGENVSEGEETRQASRVHIMAGGGSGALIMRALADARILFSAGALHVGDSDYTLALRLASDVITEQPFVPISETTLQSLQQRLQTISLLIVCPMPIGPGNLVLLHEALRVCQSGRTVLLLLPSGANISALETLPQQQLLSLLNSPERDYASGEGLKLLRRLLEAGARVVGSVGEAIEHVRTALTT